MRRHVECRLYVTVVLVMIGSAFLLNYSHWGRVRYRQSIARVGRGILLKKLHPVMAKDSYPIDRLDHQRPRDGVIMMRRRKKGHHGGGVAKGRRFGGGKDVPKLARVPSNRIPLVGQRGIKLPIRHELRLENNNHRRPATPTGSKSNTHLVQAGKRNHAQTNNTHKKSHPSVFSSIKRRKTNYLSRLSRQPVTKMSRSPHGVLARAQHRPKAYTSTPKSTTKTRNV